MAKRKSSFKRLTGRRRNPNGTLAATSSPSITENLVDLAKPIAFGLASYTGVRLTGRIAFRLARKKSPGLARHLGPWASVAAALGAWAAAEKLESLQGNKTEIVIGAGIAAVQGLLQTYIPQYAWIMNDYHLDDLAVPVAVKQADGTVTYTTPSPASDGNGASANNGAGDVDVDDFSDIPGFDTNSFKTGIFA